MVEEEEEEIHTHINQKNGLTLPERVMQILQLRKGNAIVFKQNPKDGKVYIAKGKVLERKND